MIDVNKLFLLPGQNYQDKIIMQKQELKQDIVLVFQGLDGAGNIYISNLAAAKNTQTIKMHQIVAVISAGRGLKLRHLKQSINYMHLPVDDIQEQEIRQYFGATFDFIDKNRKKGNILVHCYHGISRSATIIAAYLIRKYGYNLSQAINLLRSKKKKINPNRGFIRQLYQHYLDVLAEKKAKEHESARKKEVFSGMLLDLREKKYEVDEQLRKTRQSLSKNREGRSRSQYLKEKIQTAIVERRNSRNISFVDNKQASEMKTKMEFKLIGIS